MAGPAERMGSPEDGFRIWRKPMYPWWVSRLAPGYYARVMARRLRGEMDGK